jgi:hypothetical protein
MPSLDEFIDNRMAVGDSWRLTRNITGLSEPITKAWFLIKKNNLPTTPDGDALLSKIITTADDPEHGQIEEPAGSDGSADVRFEIQPDDYGEIAGGKIYYYDIQVLTVSAKVYTPESGRIRFKRQITQATS